MTQFTEWRRKLAETHNHAYDGIRKSGYRNPDINYEIRNTNFLHV